MLCSTPKLLKPPSLSSRLLLSHRSALLPVRTLPVRTLWSKTPQKQQSAESDPYAKHPILSRIPKFLRPYTTRFINAPVSHVTAFVILHELTALIPLVGIWYLLHQYHDTLMVGALDLPNWAIEKGTKVIDSAMERWDWGNYSVNDKFQFIMEGAYSYVIVKSLFPVRIAFSLMGMPWFAKWFVLPFTRLFSTSKPTKPAAPPLLSLHDPKKISKPRLWWLSKLLYNSAYMLVHCLYSKLTIVRFLTS